MPVSTVSESGFPVIDGFEVSDYRFVPDIYVSEYAALGSRQPICSVGVDFEGGIKLL